MNKQREHKIYKSYLKLTGLAQNAEAVRDELETIRSREQAEYTAMTEAQKQSQRGLRSKEALDSLDAAIDAAYRFTDGSIDSLCAIFNNN